MTTQDSKSKEKIFPTESDPSEQSISDLFDAVSNINEKLEIVENLKREINFSKERDKLVRWGLMIFNAVGLAVLVTILNSASITNNRVDSLHGRIDNFGNQVNEIHQILKDQESRQVETKP